MLQLPFNSRFELEKVFMVTGLRKRRNTSITKFTQIDLAPLGIQMRRRLIKNKNFKEMSFNCVNLSTFFLKNIEHYVPRSSWNELEELPKQSAVAACPPPFVIFSQEVILQAALVSCHVHLYRLFLSMNIAEFFFQCREINRYVGK